MPLFSPLLRRSILLRWLSQAAKTLARDFQRGRRESQFDGASPPLSPSPEMGQHTEEVLLEMGLSWDRLAELKKAGAIL